MQAWLEQEILHVAWNNIARKHKGGKKWMDFIQGERGPYILPPIVAQNNAIWIMLWSQLSS